MAVFPVLPSLSPLPSFTELLSPSMVLFPHLAVFLSSRMTTSPLPVRDVPFPSVDSPVIVRNPE